MFKFKFKLNEFQGKPKNRTAVVRHMCCPKMLKVLFVTVGDIIHQYVKQLYFISI